MINYAYKVRIYPNKKQQAELANQFGAARFVYNAVLEKSNISNEAKLKFNANDRIKYIVNLKNDFEWLKEPDSTTLQQSVRDLNTAFDRYYKNLGKHPKFKSKKNNYQSFRSPYNKGAADVIDSSHLKIPKIGIIRFRKNKKQEIVGRVLSITISHYKSTDKYFASILVERESMPLPQTDKTCGIDLGIKHFLTLSNGTKVGNPKFFNEAEEAIKKANQKLSRKTPYSNNYYKAKKHLALLHEKVANQRSDFLHKLSRDIINDNQIICVEDLAVKDMQQNKSLSKAIQDVSWSKFVKMLEYKALWDGRTFVKIDRFFASSQICNECGYINPKTKDLSIREWVCPECGAFHDRDINAAKNILNKGLQSLGAGAAQRLKKCCQLNTGTKSHEGIESENHRACP